MSGNHQIVIVDNLLNPMPVSVSGSTSTIIDDYIFSSGQTDDVNVNVTNASLTVTANAGTNLNTSLLALESGGNLATISGDTTSIDGKTPALGSATVANSVPVTMASNQPDINVTGIMTVKDLEDIFHYEFDNGDDTRLFTIVQSSATITDSSGFVRYATNALNGHINIFSKQSMEFISGLRHEVIFSCNLNNFGNSDDNEVAIGLCDDVITSDVDDPTNGYVISRTEAAGYRILQFNNNVTTTITVFNGLGFADTSNDVFNTFKFVILQYDARPVIQFYQKLVDGTFQLIHTIEPVKLTTPSYTFPRLHISGYCKRPSGNGNGLLDMFGISFSRDTISTNKIIPFCEFSQVAQTNGNGVEIYMYSVQNESTFNTRANHKSLRVVNLAISTDNGNIPVRLMVYKNSTITTPTYNSFNSNQPGQIDIAGTLTVPGVLFFDKVIIGTNGSRNNVNIILYPGDTLEFSITRISGASNPEISISSSFEII